MCLGLGKEGKKCYVEKKTMAMSLSTTAYGKPQLGERNVDCTFNFHLRLDILIAKPRLISCLEATGGLVFAER